MTKKRKAISNRDGVNIKDQWAARKRDVGKRWLYRVRDSSAGRYLSAVFDSDAAVDADRREPGCTAGDAWAKQQQALLALGVVADGQATVKDGAAPVISLEALGRRFLMDRENAGADKPTEQYLRSIRWTIRNLTDAGIADLADEGLADRLTAWFGRLQAQRFGQVSQVPVTARTKNAHLAIINAIANFGVKRRIIKYNPFLSISKFREGKTKRPIYSVWDMRTIVSDAHRDNPWWPHMVLAAYTGIRSESLRLITWSMIDWDSRYFRIPKEIMKTNSEVLAKIQDELFPLLVEWKKSSRHERVLPEYCSSVDSARANVLTQQYLEKVGIPRNKRSVHTFRHTAASLLTATGENTNVVMQIIGHDSVVTSKHYSQGAMELRDIIIAERWEKSAFYFRRVPPGLAIFPLALMRMMVDPVQNTRAWWKYIVLAVYTGLPESVLGAITWDMCDFEYHVIRIPSSLTGTDADLVIPLVSDLARLLDDPSFDRQRTTLLPPTMADASTEDVARRIQAYWEDLGISTNSRTAAAFWNTITCMHIAAGRQQPHLWNGRLGMLYSRAINEFREELDVSFRLHGRR
jgi:integrase